MRWRDRNRQHDLLHLCPAQRSNTGPDRRPRSDAVIDDDHRPLAYRYRGSSAAIERLAALDFIQLCCCFPLEVLIAYTDLRDHPVVEDALRLVAVSHGADGQLRLMGRAELAHDQNVQRRAQR